MLTRVSSRFSRDTEGAILVEALIALPVLLLLTLGILEFGNMMWQRQQLQVGVRDAARYWSRCRPVANGAAFMPCTAAQARNIAVFGNPQGSGNPRVPGFATTDVTVEPGTPDPTPGPTDLVTVSASMNYQGSPFFSATFGSSIPIGYWVQMRYIGW